MRGVTVKRKTGRLKTVVIGGGDAFQLHLAGYRRCTMLQLHGVFSSRLAVQSQELGVISYPSLEAVLNDPVVDAIDVAVPSSFHAEIALEAISRGKHVLVEKPIDIDPVKVRQIIDKSREWGVVAAYVSQFRFSSGIEQIAELLANNFMGELVCVNVALFINRGESYYRESPWRRDIKLSGGGVLLMNGIHPIDTLIHLLGVPKVVAAKLEYGPPEGVYGDFERLASVMMEFNPAVVANILVTSYADCNYPTTLDFIGTKGRAILTEYNISALSLQDGRMIRHRIGKSSATLFAAQLDDFGRAIRTGNQPRTPIEDGLISLETVLEAYRIGRSENV
ncbi:MAG: Gfo/Idh/MocA family protein [Desulfuromonadaceae bacterium]